MKINAHNCSNLNPRLNKQFLMVKQGREVSFRCVEKKDPHEENQRFPKEKLGFHKENKTLLEENPGFPKDRLSQVTR